MRTLLLIVAVGCAKSSTSSTESPAPAAPAPAAPAAVPESAEPSAGDLVARWLVGTFDSSAQAEADPRYFPVSLTTCRVSVPGLPEGRTLYVEQAIVGKAPYRQRIYVVEPVDATHAVTRIYQPTAPEALAGWCAGQVQPALTADDLTLREGCGVAMTLEGGRLAGSTEERACASSLRGATYATSEVVLEEGRITSWDRGFDAEGQQVWGAEAGPYEFLVR